MNQHFIFSIVFIALLIAFVIHILMSIAKIRNRRFRGSKKDKNNLYYKIISKYIIKDLPE